MAKKRDPRSIRIFGVAAHIDAGKTTVSERMLYVSGVQFRPGLVDEGTTVMDHEVEERERGITIHSAAIDLLWRGARFTLIDTPGHVDFTAEVERCMRVLDGCVLVLDSSKGVEAQSETVWRQAEAHGVVRLGFLNKLDKVGADWDAAMRSIVDRLGVPAVSLQRPWVQEDGSIQLVDLVERQVFLYKGQTAAAECVRQPWPAVRREEWTARRHDLVEDVASHDDELLERFVEEEDVTPEDLKAAIRRQTLEGEILPVLGGAALRGIGVEPLMDAVFDYLPSPLDVPIPVARSEKSDEAVSLTLDRDKALAAQAFKVIATRHGNIAWLRIYQGSLRSGEQVRNSRTRKVQRVQGLFRLHGGDTEAIQEGFAGDVLALKGLKDVMTGDALSAPKQTFELPSWRFPLPVISMAVESRRVEDRDKLIDCLRLLSVEDPTMDWRINDETGQLLVSGMGELHLEILANKLQRDFRLDVRLGTPRVAYRESLREPMRIAKAIERKLPAKEVRVYVDVAFEPNPEQDLPVVREEIPGDLLDSAPGRLLREEAVASLRADLTAGFTHGFPATQVRAVIHRIGDDENPLPSLEDTQAALSILVRELGRISHPMLLEPWMVLEVQVPEVFLSPVLGHVQAQAGEVFHVSVHAGIARVDARAPLSRMLDFTTRLRSLTQGRGGYQMFLDRYREVSKDDYRRLTGG